MTAANGQATSDNSLLVRRWFDEVWNQRRIETIRELLTEESVCRSEGGVLRGAEECVDRHYRPLTTAFPDLRVAVEATVAEGNRVAVRWCATGTHTGEAWACRPVAAASRSEE